MDRTAKRLFAINHQLSTINYQPSTFRTINHQPSTFGTFELDHLFICTSIGAPEAEALIKFGLTEGTPNDHPGQGTANRRFFFHNAMIELLWVRDSAEAQSETARPTRLWERWTKRNADACPFGFCFRPASSTENGLPFSAWEYRPQYLPSSLCFHLATNSDVLSEPMLIYLGFSQRPDRRANFDRQSATHAAGFKEITRVELVGPRAQRVSPEWRVVTQTNLVRHREGETFCLELGFDGETRGKSADFRPSLPLTFHW